METKLNIIVGLEDGEIAVFKNVKDDLRCYKKILSETKKAWIQQTPDILFKKRMIQSPQLPHFKFPQ